MVIKIARGWLTAAGPALMLAATPAFAQIAPTREQVRDQVAKALTEAAGTPAASPPAQFEAATPQKVFEDRLRYCNGWASPYCPRHLYFPEAAKTLWLEAQLPVPFSQLQLGEAVHVLYLRSCSHLYRDDILADAGLERLDVDETTYSNALDVADEAYVNAALARAGIVGVGVASIPHRIFGRSAPSSALQRINAALWEYYRAGKVSTPYLILERYCGPGYDPPAGEESHYPSPPPGPPPWVSGPRDPFKIETMRPAQHLYVIPAFSGDLCRLRTGSPFDLSCRGWIEVKPGPVSENARSFYYVLVFANGRSQGRFEVAAANRAGTPVRIN